MNVNIGEGLAIDEQNALTVNPDTVITDADLVDEDEAVEAVREIINSDTSETP